MKVRVTAEIVSEDGQDVVTPVVTEREIPDISEYGDKDEFLAIFDRYERPALEARNQVFSDLTKEYLGAAAVLKKDGG